MDCAPKITDGLHNREKICLIFTASGRAAAHEQLWLKLLVHLTHPSIVPDAVAA